MNVAATIKVRECLKLIRCYYTLWGKLIEPPHTVELLDSSYFLIPDDWFSSSNCENLDHPYYILQLQAVNHICSTAVNITDLKGKSST